MQLIDTQVGSLNEGLITVEFRGEGGELVSVRLAADANLDGDAAILRAKEIMVQLTTFADDQGPQGDDAITSDDLATNIEAPVGSASLEAPSAPSGSL